MTCWIGTHISSTNNKPEANVLSFKMNLKFYCHIRFQHEIYTQMST